MKKLWGISVQKKKKTGGNPAASPDTAKLFRTMRSSVELVRDLDGKISPEKLLILKSASLGLMFAYSELTGLPDPVDIVFKDMVEDETEKSWEEKPANQNPLLRRKDEKVS